MEKGVTLIAHIHKTGIETRHELLYLCYVNVANRVGHGTRLILVFYQPFVFEQRDGHVFLLDVYNDFACHFSFSILMFKKKACQRTLSGYIDAPHNRTSILKPSNFFP